MSFAGVAIAGKAGAGKNAFAAELESVLAERGIWTTQVAFAEGVKRELFELYGLRKEDPGGREKLIEIGDGRRQADPDYWVRAMAERVDSLRPYGVVPLITDMRYLNELEWAETARFVTVRVDATPMDRQVVLASRGEDREFAFSDTPSEVDVDDELFTVRFWNPHGSRLVLFHYACLVADLLDGTVELVA